MAEQTNEDDAVSQYDSLTGTQKSAILMMLLGEEEASEILRNLSPREVQHLGTAMYSVQGLGQDTSQVQTQSRTVQYTQQRSPFIGTRDGQQAAEAHKTA